MSNQSSSDHFNDRDLDEHLQTYHGFVRLLCWSIAGAAVILIFLAAWAG